MNTFDRTFRLFRDAFQKNKPKMAYHRDFFVMDYHGLSWMTVMDDFHG